MRSRVLVPSSFTSAVPAVVMGAVAMLGGAGLLGGCGTDRGAPDPAPTTSISVTTSPTPPTATDPSGFPTPGNERLMRQGVASIRLPEGFESYPGASGADHAVAVPMTRAPGAPGLASVLVGSLPALDVAPVGDLKATLDAQVAALETLTPNLKRQDDVPITVAGGDQVAYHVRFARGSETVDRFGGPALASATDWYVEFSSQGEPDEEALVALLETLVLIP